MPIALPGREQVVLRAGMDFLNVQFQRFEDGIVDHQDVTFVRFGFDDLNHSPRLQSFHLTVAETDQIIDPDAVIDTKDEQQVVPGSIYFSMRAIALISFCLRIGSTVISEPFGMPLRCAMIVHPSMRSLWCVTMETAHSKQR